MTIPTPPVPLVIEAVVDPAEQPTLIAAAEQLCEVLTAAAGVLWPVHLYFRDEPGQIDPAKPPHAAILSLLPELAREDEPLPQIEVRWRAWLEALAAIEIPAVMLCTIFRHVPDRATASGSARLERIRRLDLLALEISRATGAIVADLDRTLAHFGGRALGSDCRLGGTMAPEVAAHAIVTGLLSAGLDAVVPPEIAERALVSLGTLWDIPKRIPHWLNRRQPRA